MESSSVQENNTVSLECGTSLVEHEHYDDNNDSSKRNHNNNVTESLFGSSTSATSLDTLREQLLTEPVSFTSPFGMKLPLVYCDQTASNRPVPSIENYIQQICLPLYANTHTNTSITGSQSTAFVAEARQIIAEETNAKITGKASLDVVLFAGNGATSAVELLIDCLSLKDRVKSDIHDHRPVVFVGPYEHHSNLIPWRESGCEIVMIPESENNNGDVDIEYLDNVLQKQEYKNRMKMGTFTSASNVTGKLCNVNEIAATLHRHNALAFFDYATASPYVKIDMNPVTATTINNNTSSSSSAATYKDAIFISPHKMIGGISTPGILIVKKHLISQINAPNRSGGGTVFYVTHNNHRFLSNRIERYEGGTPNIVGIFRAGLTFLLKRQVEIQYNNIIRHQQQQQQQQQNQTINQPMTIEEFDCRTHREVVQYLKENAPNLVMLGDYGTKSNNLPIFSFLIRFGKRFLHYNYVCAILNDVLGIQSRGGCQCAGPYSQRLLGLTDTDSSGCDVPDAQNEHIEEALYRYKERAELLRPGYTRLSLPFKGLQSYEVQYVKEALVWVSRHGWKLMCQYRCNHRTGEWRHASRQGKPLGKNERKWLSHFNFSTKMLPTKDMTSGFDTIDREAILKETLANADKILAQSESDRRSLSEAAKMSDAELILGEDDDAKLEELRWYVYPKECAEQLLLNNKEQESSFEPNVLGALKPRSGYYEKVQKMDVVESDVTEDPIGGRKRKLPLSDMNITEKETKSSTLLFFRDGEHSGEATLEEIMEGFDEGELSEKCVIYDAKSSDWKSIDLFVNNEASCSETKMGEGKSVLGVESVCESKKASRTSSNWGQRTVTPHLDSGKEDLPRSTINELELPSSVSQKSKRFQHVKPPAKLMRTATQAVMQWNMIEDGDRLLLGLSGGKDSLSLLHCLLEFKRKLPTKFELEVCTIDPMTPSFDPSSLIPYVESLGLKYHYIRDDIVSRANTAGKDSKTVSSLCAYCARMKRGNLYNCARKNNCNKLVLAQHLDDCAESTMMSMMHNGFLRTMKAHYTIDAGDLSVIRPLIYCRESLMAGFAKSARLPVINENCPACFEEPKERARIKKMLSREETLYPNFYDNIRRSLIPLMHDDLSSILRSYTEEVVARSRKKPFKGERRSTEFDKEKEKEIKTDTSDISTNLKDASEEELIRELARRKKQKYEKAQKAAAMGSDSLAGISDPTGQVCSLNGGNGSIPCRELME